MMGIDHEASPSQPTQVTQNTLDPRRMGRNNSGLNEADISDVMCILHPCSPAAFRIVASTAESAPKHVLQNDDVSGYLIDSQVEEQETFILGEDAPHQAMDLALRFSTHTKNPPLGFVFGRSPQVCDIVMAMDTLKRVSNLHFSITVNESGVLMLRDMSTNGTMVDDIVLKGKNSRIPEQRMLSPGSVIQILSPKQDDVVKFIVRIPSREGHVQDYELKFRGYMQRVSAIPVQEIQRHATQIHSTTRAGASVKTPLVQNQYGMHWSGGEKYNVVGLIGKGAFATVYQLATKSEGQLFAAKELEKRRFIKNGVLDRKLDNEMQIMKAVNHPNIVQYVDYVDYANHMYIIMEFVPCGDLAQYLQNNVPLDENIGKKMAGQVLQALTYLHEKNITHRDIKPDNILIANMEPADFTVKLSDFGLSKVVKDNETFLKTFCGTLLYCAPEVFPHYDAHMAGKGKKRPRTRNTTQSSSKFHSYSQSVDIWSFGAVLWYSLCLKPPFEGVADNNGRGMFDKIMMTPLDATDLVKRGLSDDAVSLLMEMLNTDPATRPSPAACLRHQWFGYAAHMFDGTDPNFSDKGLGAIHEEEEIDGAIEPDVASLSLDEQEDGSDYHDEVSIHSGSMDFFDPRKSKRFKSDQYAFRDQGEMIDSSPELFHQSIPIAIEPSAAQTTAGTHQPPRREKLFGEISMQAPEITRYADVDRNPVPLSAPITDQDQGRSGTPSIGQNVEGHSAFASLLGAESMVREFHMESPHSANSPSADPNEPITPKTPGFNEQQSALHDQASSPDGKNDETPKPRQKSTFSRQINLPIPASFYYEPNDPTTHNFEYASRKSGHDYVTDPNYFAGGGVPSLPGNISATTTQGTEEDEAVERRSKQTEGEDEADESAQFVRPAPRLGRLVSTPDSFAQISLNLSSRLTIWGRAGNTHVYPDKDDTRIPKRGIFIIFHAKDIVKATENSNDDAWTKLPDLHCVVCTESSKGIRINGVLLKNPEPERRAYGRIYTGDEITVVEGKAPLKFVCEFFHGEARDSRPDGMPRFKIETESMGSTKSRDKAKSVEGNKSEERS